MIVTAVSAWLVDKLGPTIGRIAGYVLAGLLILLVGYLLVQIHSCVTAGQQEAQAKVTTSQSGAFHNSAADAVNTEGAVSANTMASEDLTRRNTEEIEHAHGANAAVDPAVNAAWLHALCQRTAYRDDPKCRMQQPHP